MFTLDAPARLSIAMALTGNRGDPALMRRQDEEAAQLGMSGAEIDAARAGRSFDLRRTRVLRLALAVKGEERADARRLAIQAGIDSQVCREIETIAKAHLPPTSIVGTVLDPYPKPVRPSGLGQSPTRLLR
ncbi:hypothetical protein [Sphingomonas sp. NFR15]|uniref:hypothetical protein n=1 Tax=Sphingomonas sp. NFR15 TaxID=1566282 RepID=UPI000B86A41B|nr:hypothetical protein [Sphingomonas sp. NFR15]